MDEHSLSQTFYAMHPFSVLTVLVQLLSPLPPPTHTLKRKVIKDIMFNHVTPIETRDQQ